MNGDWIYVTFTPSTEKRCIKPHLLHPLLTKRRIQYIRDTYGAEPDRIQHVRRNHLDVGGMIKTTDPIVELVLGTGKNEAARRSITLYLHQLEDIEAMIRLAHKTKIGNLACRRFAHWPGVLVFITERDAQRTLRFIAKTKTQTDPELTFRHREAMIKVLAKANRISLQEQRTLTPKPLAVG